ncbi:hypothetical protein Q8G50_33450, partial [Klebsiella pneumoniae]
MTGSATAANTRQQEGDDQQPEEHAPTAPFPSNAAEEDSSQRDAAARCPQVETRGLQHGRLRSG